MAFLDETGLAELWSLIKAEDAKDAKIVTGTYTGAGTYGSANPNSLTFGFVPKLIVLTTNSGGHYNAIGFILPTHMIGLASYSYDPVVGFYGLNVSLNNNTVSWYTDNNSAIQLNEKRSYYYVAIG